MNLKNIQTEVDASFLYGLLAEKEEDQNVKEIFSQMSAIEKSHAVAFLQKVGQKCRNFLLEQKFLKKLEIGVSVIG